MTTRLRRQLHCCWAAALLAATPSLDIAASGAAIAPAPPAAPMLHPVNLHAWAESLGAEISWVAKPKKLRFAHPSAEIVFEADRREILVNGVRVFLGEPPQIARGTLTISPIDRDRLLLPLLAPQQFVPRSPVRTIVLDAGHGGRDKGKTNLDLDVHEKDLALDLVRRVQARLEAGGYRVVLTRTDDTFIDLKERPARATAVDADLFLSIHFNSTTAPTVNGIETYALTPQYQRSTASDRAAPEDNVLAPGNRWDALNALLGFTLQHRLNQDLQRLDRGFKRARFVVIRDLTACPGVLVECGFLSNPAEAKLIATPEFRDRLAVSIVAGVDRFNHLLAGAGGDASVNRPSAQIGAPAPVAAPPTRSTAPGFPPPSSGAVRAPRTPTASD